jgi:hypothetical protein
MMRVVRRGWNRWVGAASLVAMLVGTHASPVLAQSPSEPSPSPTRTTLEGEVSGALGAGDRLSIRVDAAYPGGWQNLHEVTVDPVASGETLDTISYDIEDAKLTVGDHPIVVGTGAEATGDYVAVSGADVVLTTGGANLSLTVGTQVLRDLPEGVRFRLTVTDDWGASTSVLASSATADQNGGLSWGVVVAAIAGALFVGVFAGNLFASKRRPAPRPSVYTAVQRRLEDERASGSRRDARGA